MFALYLIILGGFMLRVWCLCDPFLHEWDERYHALVAKNVTLNPIKPTLFYEPILNYDFKQWTLNHIWLHKQPLSLWIISLSIKLFGCYEWAVRLPSLIFSLLAIGMTYRIALFFTNSKDKALLAAFLHAINGFVIEIASGRGATDHVDNIFFFFIETSIFLTILYINKQNLFVLFSIGISVGLALLTKSFPALIVIPIFFILVIDTIGYKRSMYYSFILFLIAFAVYSPWQYYIFSHFPKEATWENAYNFLHLSQAVEGHSGAWWWHLDYARIVWNELIYVVFTWFIVFFLKNKHDKKLCALVIWITVPYIFFSAVGTKMWAYILFTAPAIFIIESMFLFYIKSIETKYTHLRNFLFYAVIILAIRYCYERVKPYHNKIHYASVEQSKKIKDLSPYFLENKKNIVFGLDNYIECMFYYDNTTAYPTIPSAGIIDSLNKLNYKIFIVNYPNKDTLMSSKENIHFINF